MSEAQGMQQPLPEGYRLKFYKILKKLGQGGFGITYLALDTKANRPVVIKEYFPDSLSHRGTGEVAVSVLSSSKQGDFEEGIRRFQREAVTLGDFNHPNIVKVHGYFPDNNTAYFVMEYIEGQSLEAMLLERSNRPFTEEELFSHLFPVLKGLSVLHEKGILHLDVKPDNILKTAYGEPLLIDFGGARFSSGRGSKEHSALVTTLGYSPPEQYSLVTQQTPATDLYAFGMSLYHLMAPHVALPLSRDRQDAVYVDGRPDILPPLREVCGRRYSDLVFEIAERCTRIRQQDRPQSAAELLRLLENRVASFPPSPTEPVKESTEPLRFTPEPEKERPDSQKKEIPPVEKGRSTSFLLKSLLLLLILAGSALGAVYGYGWYQSRQEDQRHDAALWAEAEQGGSSHGYGNYLLNCRFCDDKVEAEGRKERLQKEEADRAADFQAWGLATEKNSIKGYEAYLESCGICEHKEEGEKRLGELRAEAARREAERLAEEKRIAEEKRRREADAKLWGEATAQDSPEGYEAYISNCVTCDRKGEAERLKDAFGTLRVNVTPSSARVRILNIVPVFTQGMTLKSGTYEVEAIAPGYERGFKKVFLKAGENLDFSMRLKSSQPPQASRPEDLPVGTRVCRGPDWKWEDQDGGSGQEGTVTESKNSGGWISVKWDNGKKNNYRWGVKGKYDLEVVSFSSSQSPQQDLPVGTRVCRGPDWEWENQDGGSGQEGTVTKSKDSDGWISVKWDNGKKNNYRWGVDGKYDLEVVSFSSSKDEAKSEKCELLYGIYERCYTAGKGADSDRCAQLSMRIIEGFQDKLGSDTSGTLGLWCGIACAEGINDEGLTSYSDFKDEYCR